MARHQRVSRPTVIMARTDFSTAMPHYKTLEDAIGHTPLVRLQRVAGPELAARGNVILGKLEGNNPAGSVKEIGRASCRERV